MQYELRVIGMSNEQEQISLRSDVLSSAKTRGEPATMTVKGRALCTGDKWPRYRNVFAFWILGLCNNFPYVVMLSAAFDIIKGLSDGDNPNTNNNFTNLTNQTYGSCELLVNHTSNTSGYIGRSTCEQQGTSVILLADILPTFIIKLLAPYFMNFLPYWFRVAVVVVSSALSFVLVALSVNEPLVIFGVALASVGSGFGEITYLSLSARYDKSTVSGWSSGTGAAGVGGALVYAGLKTFLSPMVTLLIQVVVPVIMFFTYFLLLGKPGSIVPAEDKGQSSGDSESEEKQADEHEDEHEALLNGVASTNQVSSKKRLKCPGLNKEEARYWLAHVKYIPHLWKYMLPLFAVYCAEYMINQGFFELLYNENTHIGSFCMDQATQYRWLQVIYQVGVLISRSSVSLYHFKHFWILAILQVINFVFFFTATWYLFLPSFWLTFFLVLYEGLLGGGVYVNAFYAISIQVPKIHREFSMGVASVADSTGITVAGVAAVFIHSFICSERIGYRI